MARVIFDSREVVADVVAQEPNGRWLMRSRQHAPRLTVGTYFNVNQSDVVEMAAAEMPGYAPMPEDLTIGPLPADPASMAALEKAMAEERTTLPTAAELIAAHQKNIAEGKTPPGRPTQAPPSTAGQKV